MRCPANSFIHLLLATTSTKSPMQRADLNTIDMLFPRSIIMLTYEESSPWASLMARELPLGPSDAPCPGETSTAHGDLCFSVTVLHTGKVTISCFFALDLVHAHRLLPSNPITPEMPPSLQISSTLYLAWWMEALESSVKAPPPVKPQPPLAKTLVWLKVISIGLGPRHRQQSIGPINFSLKTSSKNCGPTRKAFQLKSRTNIKAHLPITPNRLKANPRKSDPIPNAYRCVSLYQRSNSIFLIVQHPVSDGRRLQPCRVATWYTSFVLIGPSEELSLSKNFGNSQSPIRFNPSRTFSEWYRQLSNWSTKASPEESNHRISLTAGLYLGPLLASFPVRVSRMHGNSFFWMEISFIENFYRSCSSSFLPSLFSLMLCSYGSIERRLSSYLETTSMIWLCEYPFQILLQNSSIRSNLLVAAGLASARHEAKNPFLTPQNLLIMALYEIPESFVEVSLTHPSLACDMLLVSLCFRDSRDLSFKLFVCLIHLLYVCKIVLQNFVSYVPLFGLI